MLQTIKCIDALNLFSWNVTKKAYSMLIAHLWCILHTFYVSFKSISSISIWMSSAMLFSSRFLMDWGHVVQNGAADKVSLWNFRLVKLHQSESHWLCYYCCLEWGGWAQRKWLSICFKKTVARKRALWLNGFSCSLGKKQADSAQHSDELRDVLIELSLLFWWW